MAQQPIGIYLTPEQKSQRAMQARLQSDGKAIADTFTQAARSAWGSTVGQLQNIHFTDNLPRAETTKRYMAKTLTPEQQARREQAGQQFAELVDRIAAGTMRDVREQYMPKQPLSPLAMQQDMPRRQVAETVIGAGGAAEQQLEQESEQHETPQAIARMQGRNLAPEAELVPNRIIQDGNSFSAPGRIREGATVGSTNMLRPNQPDDGRRLGRINTYQSQPSSPTLQARLAMQRDLDRLKARNPVPVFGLRDESVGGFRGEQARRHNVRVIREADEARRQHRQDIAALQNQIYGTYGMEQEGQQHQQSMALQERQQAAAERAQEVTNKFNQQRIAQITQQLTQGEQAIRQADQLEKLRARAADQSLKPEERAEAEQLYMRLTLSGRDRYMPTEFSVGTDIDGKPITQKLLIDVLTGEPVANRQREIDQHAQDEKLAHAAARKAVQEGRSLKAVNSRLEEAGYSKL